LEVAVGKRAGQVLLPLDQVDTELTAVARVLETSGVAVISDKTLATLINKLEGVDALCPPVLAVLTAFLRIYNFRHERLRETETWGAVSEWLATQRPDASVEVQPFMAVLEATLGALGVFHSRAVVAGSPPEVVRTVEWMMRTHLEMVCLREVKLESNDEEDDEIPIIINCQRATVAHLPLLCGPGLPTPLVQIAKDVLLSALSGTPPSDSLADILLGDASGPSLEALQESAFAAVTAVTPPPLLALRLLLLHELISRLYTEALRLSQGDGVDAARERERERERDSVPRPHALLKEAAAWANFTFWLDRALSSGLVERVARECPECKGLLEALLGWHGRVLPIFAHLSEGVIAGSVSGEMLRLLRGLQPQLRAVWVTASSPLARPDVLQTAVAVNDNLFIHLQTIRGVITSFLPLSESARAVLIIEDAWKTLTTADLCAFLHVDMGLPSSPNRPSGLPVAPLPPLLIRAIPSLRILTHSPTFRALWDQWANAGLGNDNNEAALLAAALLAWQDFGARLTNGTTPSSEIAPLVHAMVEDREEIPRILRTAPKVDTNEDGEVVIGDVMYHDVPEERAIRRRLELWRHVDSVRAALPHLMRALDLLPGFLTPEAGQAIGRIRKSLKSLRWRFEQVGATAFPRLPVSAPRCSAPHPLGCMERAPIGWI
jgi:hypothetical protein